MNSYFTIYDFMVDELHLSQNQLLVYALIFSFTVNSQSGCYASQSNIARRIGVTRKTVNYCLNALMQKNLIEEKCDSRSGKSKVYLLKNHPGVEKFLHSNLSRNVTATCHKKLHNNKRDNKVYKKNDKSRAPQKSQPSFDLNKAEEFSY